MGHTINEMPQGVIVLIIDSDDQTCLFIKEQLLMLGFAGTIKRANNFGEARGFIKEIKFNIIFSNELVDDESAMDLFEELKISINYKNVSNYIFTTEKNYPDIYKKTQEEKIGVFFKPWIASEFEETLCAIWFEHNDPIPTKERTREDFAIIASFNFKVEKYYEENFSYKKVTNRHKLLEKKNQEDSKKGAKKSHKDHKINIPLNLNCLLVEDSANQMALLYNGLKSHLHFTGNIYKAETIAEAKELFSQHQIDMILSDLQLPGGEDGVDFLNYIRNEKKNKNIPFLLITTVNDVTTVLDAIEKGVSDYLIKPWELPELKIKLESIVKKHKI